MGEQVTRIMRPSIVVALAVYLITRITSGKISWYIHERFQVLVVLAAVVLVLMAVFSTISTVRRFQLHTHSADEGAGKIEWIFLSLPILIGLVIPARPLSADALDSRQISFSAPASLGSSGSTLVLDLPAEELSILDWARALNEGETGDHLGEEASVTGFVFFNEQLLSNQFLVGRYVVTCCVADAFPVAMAVEWKDAGALEEDSWVLVRGRVERLDMEGLVLPLIRADSVEVVPAPDQPYLFP